MSARRFLLLRLLRSDWFGFLNWLNTGVWVIVRIYVTAWRFFLLYLFNCSWFCLWNWLKTRIWIIFRTYFNAWRYFLIRFFRWCRFYLFTIIRTLISSWRFLSLFFLFSCNRFLFNFGCIDLVWAFIRALLFWSWRFLFFRFLRFNRSCLFWRWSIVFKLDVFFLLRWLETLSYSFCRFVQLSAVFIATFGWSMGAT